MVKIGDRIRILNRDGQYSRWTHKTWIVNHIAYNRDEHRGYDESMIDEYGNAEALISCKGLPISLYEYEVEIE